MYDWLIDSRQQCTFVPNEATTQGRAKMTIISVESTLTNQGDYSSAYEHAGGPFNIKIDGTFTGEVEIQRAFAKGDDAPGPDDWAPVTNDVNGTQIVFTAPINGPVYDPEEGVWYRAYLKTISSGGPITVRFSQ